MTPVVSDSQVEPVGSVDSQHKPNIELKVP